MRVEWVAMDKWRLATVMVVLAVALAALAVAVVADA
jgi:preprotein translocase subunit SecE